MCASGVASSIATCGSTEKICERVCAVSITAEEVADVFQEWVERADVDGFNIGSVTNPGSWEDIVDLLVPVLQQRGLMWKDYAKPGGTFRENLLGSKELRPDHYGARFKWDRYTEEQGGPNGLKEKTVPVIADEQKQLHAQTNGVKAPEVEVSA